MQKFDLNADLAEWDPGQAPSVDLELLPFLNSCNLSCTAHAGSKEQTLHIAKMAAQLGVCIGAHPSYPDRKNFGRLIPNISLEDLRSSLIDQLTLLKKICLEVQKPLHHIKAHGALYHQLSNCPQTAELFLEIHQTMCPSALLYVQGGSTFHKQCQLKGIPHWAEAFLDRRYESDGTLTPRHFPDALLHSPDEVLQQLQSLTQEAKVRSRQGDFIFLQAQTFCLHGDHPQALTFAQAIQKELSKAKECN